MQFMDESNSCLVPYELVAVGEDDYPDWRGQHWAEPDIAAAAVHLCRLADDPAWAQQLGQAARLSLQQRLGPSASAAAITARLEQIRRARPVPWSP
jgi:hypothetical protein